MKHVTPDISISSVKFALEIYKEKIVVDKFFGEAPANELQSKQISGGTILFATEEMLLDPAYVFGYNNQSGVRFLGRYDVVLVADRFDCKPNSLIQAIHY